MSKNENEVDAPIDFTDESGRRYEGTFTLKTSLSAREESEVGRRRRAILGPNPVVSDADMLDHLYAEYQAQLCVRPVKVPDFWKAGGDELPRSVILSCGRAMEVALADHRGVQVKDEAEAQRLIRAAAKKEGK